jgi:hypothetical protein
MDDKRRGARRLDRRGEGEQGFGRLLLVDADAAFDGDRNVDRGGHRSHAFANQRRLAHETGAEAAALNPVGWAAAVEIDLVIAEVFADPRRFDEPPRLRPPKLQRDRTFLVVKADQPLARAEHDGVRRHHFGVEARAAGQEPVERAASPVGPVHHGRHAESK